MCTLKQTTPQTKTSKVIQQGRVKYSIAVLHLHTAGVSHFTASTQLHSWNYYASEVKKTK